MKEREKFSSRLGFILISAGCAIGLGNVWRFPYVVGQYGGALFVLIYLFYIICMMVLPACACLLLSEVRRKLIRSQFSSLPQGL